MTMKERVKKINHTATENFEKAKGMLEMFNDIYGTDYGWLNKRVVMYETLETETYTKYAVAHDAYTNL